MSGLPTVILLLETSIEYGRGLLRGIIRYERLHGPWSIHASAGHFQHSLPPVQQSGVTSVGVITRLASLAEAEAIASAGVPAFALESSLEEPELTKVRTRLHEIRSSSSEIGRMGADYLVGLGLGRFAYCGFRRCPWSQIRKEAFASQVKAHGFPSEIYVPPTGKGEPWEHDLQHLGNWLDALPKSVGVMACNDMCGRQVLQACADRGLRVPDEVSVVGVDNDEMLCELADPPLSSIALDLEGAGYAAAVLLDAAMTGGAPEGRQVVPVNPVKVVERRSTEPVLQTDPLVADALRFLRDHAGRPIGVPDIGGKDAGRIYVLRDIKSGSSEWVHKEKEVNSFGWQDGYGAFTVSASALPRVRQYIWNQVEHHQKKSFEEEYGEFLEKSGVRYDERYLW